MASVADLGVRVLQRLNVISAVETPSAEDAAKAQQKVTDAHTMLAALGHTRWTISAWPAYAVPALIECAAALASPEFGRVGTDAASWDVGEMMLCRVTAVPYMPAEESVPPDPGYI